MRAALANATLRERLTAEGLVVDMQGPADLARFVEAEIAKWGEAVRISGATAE